MNRTSNCGWATLALLAATHLWPSSAAGRRQAEEAAAIHRASGIRGGLVVHFGCGDARLIAALHANERYLVQGLDPDPVRVARARAYVRALGLYGKVSIDRLSGNRLPYTDNRVNLLVAKELGEVRLRKPAETPDMLGMSHHRCYRDRAAEQYLVLGRVGVEFLNTHSGKMIFNHWIRGMCQFGVLPCNGLLYVTPHPGACYVKAMFDGFSALAARRAGEPISPQEPAGGQLERGPAYAEIPASASQNSNPRDWPTYRHDAARSGITQTAVPAAAQLAWQADVGGRLSGLVAARGKLFVSSIGTHTVLALNADDGAVVWSRTVGGRVDSPPTICSGLVLFGSADGWVYCLRAADGELVWRFRAAPEDRRIVAHGRLASVWPVHGSVLVDGDVVFFAAGQSSYLDGGIYLYRLNAASGALLSVTRIDSRDPKTGWQPAKAIEWVRGFDMPGALPDVLSCQGGKVYMRHMAIDRDGAVQDSIAPHLYSPAGFLDGTWWHRTYWLYGTEKGSGAAGWVNGARRFPCGEILVSAGTQLYGYGRDNYSKHGSHPRLGLTHYRLFAADAQPRHVPGSPPDAKQTGSPVHYRWTAAVPLLVKAMVLAGETLWIAGPPDLPGLEDAAASLEGRKGGPLWAVAASDGSRLSQHQLDSPPLHELVPAGAV